MISCILWSSPEIPGSIYFSLQIHVAILGVFSWSTSQRTNSSYWLDVSLPTGPSSPIISGELKLRMLGRKLDSNCRKKQQDAHPLLD